MRKKLRTYAVVGVTFSWIMLGCAPSMPRNDGLLLGEQLYRGGRYAEAITQLSEFVSTNPLDAQGHYMLADSLYLQYVNDRHVGLASTRDLQRCLLHFSRALEIDPSHAEAYSQRGVVRLALGDASGSKEDYDVALQINPRLSRAYFNRGYWYEVQQRYQEAIADYESFVDLSENETWKIETKKKIHDLRLRGHALDRKSLDDIVL